MKVYHTTSVYNGYIHIRVKVYHAPSVYRGFIHIRVRVYHAPDEMKIIRRYAL